MPLLPRPVFLSHHPFPSPSHLPLSHSVRRTHPVATTFSSPASRFDGVTTGNDGGHSPANRRRPRRWGAVERESEFEIDRDKAREALEKLDQQLKALSEKDTASSKKRTLSSSSSSSYPDPDPDRNWMIGKRTEEAPEIYGSYLAYSAVALLILTILNNVLFNVFIKPSVDGQDPSPTVARESPSNAAAQQAPPLSEQR